MDTKNNNTTEELDATRERAESERRRRYPLLDIVNNRAEIREIGETAIDYGAMLYPTELKALKDKNLWELATRVTIEFFKEAFAFLSSKKNTENGEVSIDIGDFMGIGIEYSEFDNAEIEGSFNPVIHMKKELMYDNKIDINNKLCTEIPVFENVEVIQEISTKVQEVMKTKYDAVLPEWRQIIDIFVCYMRAVKQYLVMHKDDDSAGVEIDFANVVDIDIEKYIGDEGDEYCIQIVPGQIAKMEFAKNNGITELNDKADNNK